MKNMKTTHVRYTLVGFAIAAIIIIPVLIWAATNINTPSKQTNKVGDTVLITGKLVCLPHKDKDGPQTLECAIGLQDDKTGYYYGLKNTNSVSGQLHDMEKRIGIKGKLEAAPSENIYDIAGVISVESVIK